MRIAAVFLTLVALPCWAVDVPPDLFNKTITVSYTVTIPARRSDGRAVPAVRNSSRTIYISNAGRVFARVSRIDGRRFSETKEAAPGDQANSYRFEGGTLVGVMPFSSGAAQMTIAFDSAGGQTCNAKIVMGRDSGKPLRFKGVSGMMYEATGPGTVSNMKCKIRSGNAFAEQ